jgi:8-oxo-dGTP pyrophosphatase MutT (NUDIX family)
MVAGSILPVSKYKGKLYFLFGKENSMEDSAKGFSDFGGGTDKGETPFEAAMREGGEELTGFLGDSTKIRKLVKKTGFYKLQKPHNAPTYHVHIVPIPYDENLPTYYNNNHQFLWNRMDKRILNDSKLFEKIEIQWFDKTAMKKRRNEFRGFYQEIVDQILVEYPKIATFVSKKANKTRKLPALYK